MKLCDLKEKSAVPLLEFTVVDWEEVVSYGEGENAGTIWPIKIKDDSGEGKLKLFNKQIDAFKDKIKEGCKMRLLKGWCNKIHEEIPELSTGKFGELFVLND